MSDYNRNPHCRICDDPNHSCWDTWRPGEPAEATTQSYGMRHGVTFWHGQHNSKWVSTAAWICDYHLRMYKIKYLLEQLKEGIGI